MEYVTAGVIIMTVGIRVINVAHGVNVKKETYRDKLLFISNE